MGGSDVPKAHPAQCQENQGFSSFDTSVGNPAFKRGLSGIFYLAEDVKYTTWQPEGLCLDETTFEVTEQVLTNVTELRMSSVLLGSSGVKLEISNKTNYKLHNCSDWTICVCVPAGQTQQYVLTSRPTLGKRRQLDFCESQANKGYIVWLLLPNKIKV